MLYFEDITKDGRLWAVRYPEDEDNILSIVFDQWTDAVWLRDFFTENLDDLQLFFKITDVDQAIYDTVRDADILQCLILDLDPEADLDRIFRHLEPARTSEMLLGKEKAKGERINRHPSWLRIYAIKLANGKYLVTGGAIKLTATMAEREHTLKELMKMEQVRNFLLQENIIDDDGLNEYMSEL
ncbi:MAG: hypothetical protein LIP03_12295 [Bacteroidales bacterium]|nr:hypothetical protein [Bacteroidales bacterium]